MPLSLTVSQAGCRVGPMILGYLLFSRLSPCQRLPRGTNVNVCCSLMMLRPKLSNFVQ